MLKFIVLVTCFETYSEYDKLDKYLFYFFYSFLPLARRHFLTLQNWRIFSDVSLGDVIIVRTYLAK